MNPSEFPALARAHAHATDWLQSLDARQVAASLSYHPIVGGGTLRLPRTGLAPAAVVDELVALVEGGLHASTGGRFYGWVAGGALESALAADWLCSAWDQIAALRVTSPAAADVEAIAGAWMTELLDLPRDASFAFTTGCQLAHFTSLAAARHALLARRGWDVEADGLFGAPAIRVVTSDQRHASIDRAVRFLGIGARNLVAVETDHAGRVTAAALQRVLAVQDGPMIVVLDAADLNIAACDPFSELIPIAHAAGAWVHIDGAFGLLARASRSKRHLLDGVERADSWATDAHKWLNVPFDCGVAIVRDRAAHRAAMTVSASYIASAGETHRDQIDWNPEWSHRARGFVVWAALRELGADGVESLIDRSCGFCHDIVTGIGALDGAEAMMVPDMNQGLVRFLDQRDGASDADHDRRTDAVIAAINATGEAFFSGAVWRGRHVMRVSVVNWRTSASDVARAIAAVREGIAACRGRV